MLTEKFIEGVILNLHKFSIKMENILILWIIEGKFAFQDSSLFLNLFSLLFVSGQAPLAHLSRQTQETQHTASYDSSASAQARSHAASRED